MGRRLLGWLRGLCLARHLIYKVIAIASVGGALMTRSLGPGDGVTYMTGRAQTRSIAFGDGSVLHMDAMTTVFIGSIRGRRTLYLAEGQIQASIQHGISQPLDVVVHGILLYDLGTQFVACAHGDVVSVSLTSGEIRVIELHPDGTQENPININGKEASRTPTYLFPGDLARLEMHDNTVLITRDKNSLDEARNRSSWIEGRLIAGSERLDEVLWELNARSAKTHLLIGDSEIGQKRIGGNFDLMHVDEFLQSARMAFGFKVVPVKEPGVDATSTYILRLPTDDRLPVSRHH
jgi:ferric-dicitrate binding protein FerR (iron transport regulator)